MPLAPPPDWLKPGAIAYHSPSNLLFIAERLTSDGREYRLYDAPAELPGTSYLLSECRHPTLSDFANGLIVTRGRPVSIRLEGNTAILWNDKARRSVQLSDHTADAALSLANFFRGEVVKGDGDKILSLLPGCRSNAYET